jgi:hypothetical protein
LDKRPELRKTDMRFGTWNVKRLYRAGSLIRVAKEIATNKLDLEGVQEVRWNSATLNKQTIINFSTEMGMKIMN